MTSSAKSGSKPSSVAVIAGIFKGAKLATPGGDTHPMGTRERNAIFNMIGPVYFAMLDISVLDIFAGSGALGIEALSRGATSATFVDSSPVATRTIIDNLRRLGFMVDKPRPHQKSASANKTGVVKAFHCTSRPYQKNTATSVDIGVTSQKALKREKRLSNEETSKGKEAHLYHPQTTQTAHVYTKTYECFVKNAPVAAPDAPYGLIFIDPPYTALESESDLKDLLGALTPFSMELGQLILSSPASIPDYQPNIPSKQPKNSPKNHPNDSPRNSRKLNAKSGSSTSNLLPPSPEETVLPLFPASSRKYAAARISRYIHALEPRG